MADVEVTIQVVGTPHFARADYETIWRLLQDHVKSNKKLVERLQKARHQRDEARITSLTTGEMR